MGFSERRFHCWKGNMTQRTTAKIAEYHKDLNTDHIVDDRQITTYYCIVCSNMLLCNYPTHRLHGKLISESILSRWTLFLMKYYKIVLKLTASFSQDCLFA